MKSNKTLSIIIPVYNTDKYLSECLDSIVNENVTKTYGNEIEIILVDDGSSDDSPQICDEYASEYSYINVIHKENGGLSSARNSGIKNADGDWLAFIDSDDLVAPNYVVKVFDFIKRADDADILMFHFKEFTDIIPTVKHKLVQTKLKKVSKSEAMYYLTTLEWGNFTWNKLVRRKIFFRIEFPVGRLFEDVATSYRCFERAKNIYVFDDVLYFYRQREASILHSVNFDKQERALKEIISLRKEQILFFDQNGYLKARDSAKGQLLFDYCSYVFYVESNRKSRDAIFVDAVTFCKKNRKNANSFKDKVWATVISFNPKLGNAIHNLLVKLRNRR